MRPGDKVIVLAGKDKGKSGTIIEIDRTNHRIKVESIAMKCFTQKADKNRGTPGKKIVAESFIHISNVAYLDKQGKKCKLARKNGKRINKKTGEEI
jgi:large subunit ribosomal protein L24